MNNELTHHGVKGMKWGVRMAEKRAQKRASYHEDYNRVHSKKSIKTMSDTELKSRNNRLNMEKQYKELSKPKMSAGKKAVTGVLVGSATAVAGIYIQKYMRKGIEYTIKRVAQT